VFLVGGGILAARLGDRLAKFGFVVIGIIGSGFTAILYMGTSWIVVSFIGVALWGCATALISGPSRTLLQRASPVSIHGRVMSTDLMAGSTAELTGLAIAGVCVSLFGVQWTFLGLGTFVILATLRVWQPRRTTVAVCAPQDDSGSTPSSAGASRSASPR
jgi:MFS family permease